MNLFVSIKSWPPFYFLKERSVKKQQSSTIREQEQSTNGLDNIAHQVHLKKAGAFVEN